MRPVFFFPRCTVIDCGASRTTLAVFSRGRTGRMRLEQHAVAALAVEPGQDGSWLAKTSSALRTLRTQSEPVGPVTVVLPPHLTLMKMLTAPRVEAAKREKIIQFEGQQSIPYPLTDVVWDRQLTGESSDRGNVLLCAAKLEVLDPLCAALTAAGFAPAVLRPSALALATAYRELPLERPIPTLLVNLGSRSATLVLIDQNSMQARSLPLGGHGVTQQIAEELTCDLVRAEEIKIRGPHGGEVTRASQSFSNRLAQEIIRTMVYFRQPVAADRPLRLMLTGGAARLPGLAGLLAIQLNVPVLFFAPADGIKLGRGAAGFDREEHGPTLADLMGGAALQFSAGHSALNLLPHRLRHQTNRRKIRPWMAAAAGLAVAALIPAIAQQHKALAEVRAKNAAMERALAPLQTEVTRSEAIRRRLEERRQKQEAWQKIAQARTGWLGFIGELQERFGLAGDVWLERMQVVPLIPDNNPARTANDTACRIGFTGRLRLRAEDGARSGTEAYRQVRSLLESVAGMAAVAAVENERLEPAAGELLRFDFVVVLKEAKAL